jgi:hypothetical protein
VPKLLDFAFRSDGRVGPAVARLFGRKKAYAEWEQQLVSAYLAYGHADANGVRAIDVFLREHRRELEAAEVEALEALQQTAWPSLFEVQRVEVDVGLQLTDLVVGEEVFVRERSATHQMKKFDLFLGWIVSIGDHLELTGAGCGVPRGNGETVRKALTRELRKLRKRHPETPDRILLREAIPAGQTALREAVANWRPPRMVTMDGEDVVFCEAVFDVSDLAAVRARLTAHPDLEDDEDGFSWVDRKGRKPLGSGPLHLGSIRFEKGRMTLETTSRERLECGKRLLVECLVGVARHRVDAIKDFEVAMAEARDRPVRQRGDEIPDEVQAQLLAPILQQHIDSWIDEHIPALNGKTPRQAVQTKAGRAKVLAMLKDQENTMQRQLGGQQVDFARVYRELGLTR